MRMFNFPIFQTDLKSLATEENILADPIIQQKLLHSNEKLAYGQVPYEKEGQIRHIKTAAPITKGVSPTVGSREVDYDSAAARKKEAAETRIPRSAERTQVSFAVASKEKREKRASHNVLPDRKANELPTRDMWLPMAKTQREDVNANEWQNGPPRQFTATKRLSDEQMRASKEGGFCYLS
ncbi:hypothetical protein TELCIR_04731 [Teladorsagia circumcincta]|uniref:Uncharacterized protein n=1 Tax=Teladorsagia circumcincta TaxID=45464 RepID=A0A2G9USU2_TELCI|nr:hypothetical protein TELCIR_04731 [Teladorsagia circumcincta]